MLIDRARDHIVGPEAFVAALKVRCNHVFSEDVRDQPQPVIFYFKVLSCTYDHRVRNTGLPVRSAILKPHAGVLVVGSVTTSESALLYVFDFLTFINVMQSDGFHFFPFFYPLNVALNPD
jgi:hypothetical protein